MKYYIINSEGKEVSFDLTMDKNEGIRAFRLATDGQNTSKSFYVKNLGQKKYISEDKLNWRKLPRVLDKDNLVNVTESLSVYRGFKPSGLSQANAGDLITDMPGKIVKVMTAEGAMVSAGDTLLILEAMKMENEIKAGISGTVKAVHVSEGEVLESGHLMIEIEES